MIDVRFETDVFGWRWYRLPGSEFRIVWQPDSWVLHLAGSHLFTVIDQSRYGLDEPTGRAATKMVRRFMEDANGTESAQEDFDNHSTYI